MRTELAVWILAGGVVFAGGLEPYGLECEARANPVGIDTAQPRLGWKLRSPKNGDRQTAYEILAATSPEKLASGKADLWSSGRVASDQSLWISYRGAPLASFQHVWWKVRVWSDSGEASPWSEPAQWVTAVLDPAAWKAGWIAHPDRSLRSGPLPLFRKEFTLDKPLRSALAVVSGAGFHELRINGNKVGDHVLAPAWSNYRSTVYYEVYDVTSMLQRGANAIGALIGNGFYNVAGGRYVKYTGSFGNPRLFVQIHLQFEDGTSRDIGTDGSWRVHDGPITFSCIYGGEDYDARLEPFDWDKAGFDDNQWSRAAGSEPAGATMRAQSSPPIRVKQTFRPVRITEPKPGVLVYDLGQNFAGWPAITASGPAGSRVRMKPGELLDSSGLVSQRSSGGPVYFSYTLKGTGRETWEPRFTYYGFRYVEVEGVRTETARGPALPVLEQLEGRFVHLDAPRAGAFVTSSERLNKIHALIDAAVRSNLQHVVTDCPHREKLGWLEQTYLMGPSLLYNWDLRTFLPKMSRDMREAQSFNGLVPDIAPEYVVFRGGFRDSPEWGSAAVFVPWMAWQWYGDSRTLADSWSMMKGYEEYLATQEKNGLLTHGLGDWYDIGPRPPGASQLTPLGLTATATYLEGLRVVAQTAKVLDKPAEQQRFAAKAAAVQAAFDRAYFKPAETTYATGSQTSLAMPLAFGLASLKARPALLDKLVADVRARGNHTSAGDIGYRYVLAALRQGGRSDVIFDLANQSTAPSYAAQLAAGATSLTEAWDANPASSQNHLMLGHIEEWFYAGLAGISIDPDSPGIAHLFIRPEPVGGVEWVKATWETPRGTVGVNWRVNAMVFHLSVEIPPGMTADVRMPDGRVTLIVSGRHELQSSLVKKGTQ